MVFKHGSLLKGLKSLTLSKKKKHSSTSPSPSPPPVSVVEIPAGRLRDSSTTSRLSFPPIVKCANVVSDSKRPDVQLLRVELAQDQWKLDLPQDWGFEPLLNPSSILGNDSDRDHDVDQRDKVDDSARDRLSVILEEVEEVMSQSQSEFSILKQPLEEDDDEDPVGTSPVPSSEQVLTSISHPKPLKRGLFGRKQSIGTTKARLSTLFKRRIVKKPRSGMKRWISKHLRSPSSACPPVSNEPLLVAQLYDRRFTPPEQSSLQEANIIEPGSQQGSPTPCPSMTLLALPHFEQFDFEPPLMPISPSNTQASLSLARSTVSKEVSGGGLYLRQSPLRQTEEMMASASSSRRQLSCSTPPKSKLVLVSRVYADSLTPCGRGVASPSQIPADDSVTISLAVSPSCESNLLRHLPMFDEFEVSLTVSTTPMLTSQSKITVVDSETISLRLSSYESNLLHHLPMFDEVSFILSTPPRLTAPTSRCETIVADSETISLLTSPYNTNLLRHLPMFDETSLAPSTPRRSLPATARIHQHSPALTETDEASNVMPNTVAIVDTFNPPPFPSCPNTPKASRTLYLATPPRRIEVLRPLVRIPDWVLPKLPETYVPWHLKVKAKLYPPTPPSLRPSPASSPVKALTPPNISFSPPTPPVKDTLRPPPQSSVPPFPALLAPMVAKPVEQIKQRVRIAHSPPKPIPLPTVFDIQRDLAAMADDEDEEEEPPEPLAVTLVANLYGYFTELAREARLRSASGGGV